MPNSLPQSCLELAERMIAFDTVVPYHSGRPDAELELSQYLQRVASEWGLATRVLPIEGAAPNLLVECPASDSSSDWLLFDGHLDTVGVNGMIIPPFEPTVREGRLYGRGACDTKGPGAAMFWALRQYARQQQRPSNVAVLFSVGEEHVQLGARKFVADHLGMLDAGERQFRGVIVGEPTGMDVLGATGGFVRWTIGAHGRAAHSSRPERGHNAIYDMARVVTTIQEQYLPTITATHPLIGQASAAITVVRGGQQVNVIPSHCQITFDRRLVPGESGDAEVAKVRQLLATLTDRNPGMQLEHSAFESAPPMAEVDGGALAKATQRVLSLHGLESHLTGELFTTNGNHFAAAGIPTVVVGPGDIAQAHTVDEWIALEELERGVEGYLTLMNGL